MDGTHGDLVVAIATIVGAFIGVAGTLIVDYLRKERKTLRFVIDSPEDLAAALRNRGGTFDLKINDIVTQTLVASGITVQNIGNVIISDLAFDISVPGHHSFAQAQASSQNAKLVPAISISQTNNPIKGLEHEPYFAVSMPYLNPGETFKITAFSDGDAAPANVSCRLPGVTVRIAKEEDVQRRGAAVEEVTKLVAKLGAAGTAGLVASAIAALIATLSGH